MSKHDVTSWTTVTTYVATYPSDGDDGACDVDVQIGESDDGWHVRTRDDAGGSDDAGDTVYGSRVDAEAAAEQLAEDRNEGDDGESASDYLTRQTEIRIGDEDPDGEWACYWSTVGDGSRVEGRYATDAQAQAAVDLANEQLRAANPSGGGTTLLCGYEVRRLDDGQWVASEDS